MDRIKRFISICIIVITLCIVLIMPFTWFLAIWFIWYISKKPSRIKNAIVVLHFGLNFIGFLMLSFSIFFYGEIIKDGGIFGDGFGFAFAFIFFSILFIVFVQELIKIIRSFIYTTCKIEK